MKFPCRRIVGAGVIILMALLSVAPVRLTHAHGIDRADGKEFHKHDHGHDHGHSHHSHGHTHHGDQRGKADGVGAFSSHTHVYVLGMDFVLPSTPAGNDKQQSNPAESELDAEFGVIVRHDAAIQNPASLSTQFDEVKVAPSVGLPIVARSSKVKYATARFSPPLCDAARLERTGVLVL